MTRGESTQTKVHLQGRNDDFLVFVDDVDEYKKWLKGDTSIPLARFVSTFQVFLTHKQGTQGTYDAAAKNILAAEFDTENVDEVIKKILKNGTMQNMEMPGRQGSTNDSMSSMKSR
ncbi:hypothetical protein E4U54_006992 [Claviceps lovelessii]|nr:hypothetical protein E4U54_006992 [Claviceps lovelessii]